MERQRSETSPPDAEGSGGRAGVVGGMRPPTGPPPAMRRSTHDTKWLHNKLQKMGLRDPAVARVEPVVGTSNKEHVARLEAFWMGGSKGRGGGGGKGGKHAKIGLADA